MFEDTLVAIETPKQVIERFYEAERKYMQSPPGGERSFEDMQATLDPNVVLH